MSGAETQNGQQRGTAARAAIAIASIAALTLASVAWLPSGTTGAAGGLALNQPTDPMIGLMAPASDADTLGMYSPVVSWPLIAIHSSVVQSGELITYGSPLGVGAQGGVQFDHWNPATNAHVQSAKLQVDSFCDIQTPTTGGKLFLASGGSPCRVSSPS